MFFYGLSQYRSMFLIVMFLIKKKRVLANVLTDVAHGDRADRAPFAAINRGSIKDPMWKKEHV